MDWLVFGDPGLSPLVSHIESRRSLWVGTAMMKAELYHVLGRGVAAQYQPDLDRINLAFTRHCQLVEPPELALGRPRCSDPDDQKFIDLALWLAPTGPTVLISRDRAVLKVAKRAARLGLTIQSPTAWLKQLADATKR